MEFQIEDLGKSYGEKSVFRHVNLCLKEGDVYCLMAPSGTGKTTLFRILMGLEAADEGRLVGFDRVHFAPVAFRAAARGQSVSACLRIQRRYAPPGVLAEGAALVRRFFAVRRAFRGPG